MALFTVQNAAEMGRRGNAILQARRLNPPPQEEPKQIPLSKPLQLQSKPIDLRVRTIDKMIDRTTRNFLSTDDPREMQALAMALDRLLGSWSLLTGHPRPGVRRVTKDSNRSPGPAFSPQDHEDPPSPEPL